MFILVFIDFYYYYLQLVSIFEELRQMEENGNLHQFDPKCTIFVCNKWDQVPSKEDTKVWKKIAEKLQSVLPTMSKEEITKQMFRLSVKEVSSVNTTHLLVKFKFVVKIKYLFLK